MSAGRPQLWKHRKSGGFYYVRAQKSAKVFLFAGETVIVQITDGVMVTAMVTDDVPYGEHFMVYTEAYQLNKSYIRPASMFHDGRFVQVEADPYP